MKHLLYLAVLISLISCIDENQEVLITNSQISQLDSLLKTDKFTENAFQERGLIPSESFLRNKMNETLNKCLEEIIETSQNAVKPLNIKEILNRGLNRFNRIEFDTEEKEFIADEFYKITNILQVDYNENINKWLYGKLLYFIIDRFAKDKDEIQDTIMNQCNTCQDSLALGVIRYRDNIPERWMVVKCKKCKASNAIKIKQGIEEICFINCITDLGYQPSYDSVSADSIVKIRNMK